MNRVKLFFFLFFGLLLLLIGGELYFQSKYPSSDNYTIWEPGRSFTFRPDSTYIYGVSGKANFTVNKSGLRHTAQGKLDANPTSKVLALGGSTTECLYLDDTETWPSIVERNFNNTFSIVNAGKSGTHSGHHIIQLEQLLSYGSYEKVLLLVGVNDLMTILANDGKYPTEDSTICLDKCFSYGPHITSKSSILLRSGWFKALRQWRNMFFQSKASAATIDGSIYRSYRKHRQMADTLLYELPDMNEALSLYAANLNRIADVAAKKNTELVLITQPTIWNSQLTNIEKESLWMGGAKPRYMKGESDTYYSISTMALGMVLLNHITRQTARERNIQLIDLATKLPKSSRIFYDDCHFTEEGARQVAAIIAQEMKGI